MAKPRPGFKLSGFAQVNYAVRVTGKSCSSSTACDLMLGDQRLQLKVDGVTSDGVAAFTGRVDLFYDAVLGEPGLDAREVYAELNWPVLRVRAGRQIITWGVGDLLFINDIFPKDWVAFFTGRPLQYLKLGSDAIKIGVHPGPLDVELVAVPFFQSDGYPTGERLMVTSSMPDNVVGTTMDSRDRSFENIEVAGKISTYLADWELSVYAARTFFKTPAVEVAAQAGGVQLRYFFPRLDTFGASATGGLLGGVLSVEGGYYFSEEDQQGIDPAIDNSQVRGLVGYAHPLWTGATAAVQGYVEVMLQHSKYVSVLPDGVPQQDAARAVGTLRFTQQLLHDALTMSLFAYVGATDVDAYLIPSVRYALRDELWLELGGNVFLKHKDHTFFGRLWKNSNVYLTTRYAF